MPRVRTGWPLAAALSLVLASPAAAAPVVQELDWTQFEWFNNGLGGRPYVWTNGGYWRQTFTPGLASIGWLGLDLQFYAISDLPHTYDVLVNGTTVGSFGLPAAGGGAPPVHHLPFVGSFSFAPILGPDYLVEIRQTTPTPVAPSGSFALETFNSPDIGYTVGHSSAAFAVSAVPEPATAALVAGGVSLLALAARRRPNGGARPAPASRQC